MPAIVHFDIATDEPERARKFYETLFGWNFASPPGMEDFYLFGTKDLEGKDGVGGGLGRRGEPSQRITVYIGVEEIDKYMKEVEANGGKLITAKMPVPGWGWAANCLDTEGNAFGLWQDDPGAA